MACGASSYDSLTLRAPSWCFVFFVVSLARERASRIFPRSRPDCCPNIRPIAGEPALMLPLLPLDVMVGVGPPSTPCGAGRGKSVDDAPSPHHDGFDFPSLTRSGCSYALPYSAAPNTRQTFWPPNPN